MGDRCLALALAQVAADTANQSQKDKATELLESGGLLEVRKNRSGLRVFLAVGSEGALYLTCETGCNCAGGLRGKYRCHHRFAAQAVVRSRAGRA